jgi:hypothetical protein
MGLWLYNVLGRNESIFLESTMTPRTWSKLAQRGHFGLAINLHLPNEWRAQGDDRFRWESCASVFANSDAHKTLQNIRIISEYRSIPQAQNTPTNHSVWFQSTK